MKKKGKKSKLEKEEDSPTFISKVDDFSSSSPLSWSESPFTSPKSSPVSSFYIKESEAKRRRREERFASEPQPENLDLSFDDNQPPTPSKVNPSSSFEDENQFGDYIKGTNTELEKSYLRLTAPPKPHLVRTEETLVKSLQHVKSKWLEAIKKHSKKKKKQKEMPATLIKHDDEDYIWIKDQLQSIRQDLVVQGIKNPFALHVYQVHCRIAMEVCDIDQFSQCLHVILQLIDILDHKSRTTKLKRQQANKTNKNEFLSYQLLYYVHTKNHLGLATALQRLTPSQKQDESIEHAMNVITCVHSFSSSMHFINWGRLRELYDQAPNMSGYIMDWIMKDARLKIIQMMTSAFWKKIPISYISKQIGFEDNIAKCQQYLNSNGFDLTDDDNDDLHLETLQGNKK